MPIPIIYTSEEEDNIEIRLMASRSGGEEFFYKVVDLGQLIEKIEEYTNASPLDHTRFWLLTILELRPLY